MTNLVNTGRLVRVTATVPEICAHNVKLGPGCFCPHCPTASLEELRPAAEPNGNPTIEDMEDLQSDVARLEGEVEKEKAKVQGAYADGMRDADIMADRASQNQAVEPSGDPAQELIAARLILEQVKYSEETKTHLPHSILTGIRAWLKRNEAYRRALRAENRPAEPL